MFWVPAISSPVACFQINQPQPANTKRPAEVAQRR
jgi:hypothetical protein